MRDGAKEKVITDTETFLKTIGEMPKCSTFMQSRLLSAIPDEGVMTIAFPVVDTYANPAGTMQAGFYSAAFDNVFGPLCLMATGTPHSVAINLNTEYHRPTLPGDELTITARVIRNGKRKVFMSAEGFNRENKLVATATCNYLRLDSIK